MPDVGNVKYRLYLEKHGLVCHLAKNILDL